MRILPTMIGILLAGSDGAWFPIPNLIGIFIMLLSVIVIKRGQYADNK